MSDKGDAAYRAFVKRLAAEGNTGHQEHQTSRLVHPAPSRSGDRPAAKPAPKPKPLPKPKARKSTPGAQQYPTSKKPR